MENKEYKKLYNYYLDLFNDYCEKVFCSVKSPNRLAEAMKYSLFAGGKRVRPVLMLAFTDILGGDINEVLPFALALECIHTSSLIHDDLPALDNDKLRRGKPTSHVAFDEPTAILAGDALMNFAYEHALENCESVKMIKAVEYLAKSTGVFGMISGQMTDIESEGEAFGEDVLLKIHDLKTCKLLTVPFAIPSILYCDNILNDCQKLGYYIGLIFQFTDDLLDVVGDEIEMGKSVGKDLSSDKLTSVKLYGIDGVRKKIDSLKFEIENILKSIEKSDFLKCFTKEIIGRV